MTAESKKKEPNWQLRHYSTVGRDYGAKHFTQADNEYTHWILSEIASVKPDARRIAEVGAGTCVFSSLLGKVLKLEHNVTCYEPVKELLESQSYDNVDTFCGGAIEFSEQAPSNTFDLIFTKDTAHHFDRKTLDSVHFGFCQKLTSGGRYLMVVRTPPENSLVPIGRIASSRWSSLYTSLEDLLEAIQGVPDWKQTLVTRWEKSVETPVEEWIEGVRQQDTWSVFSALNSSEILETVEELTDRFKDAETFDFLHQYDVVVVEKN